MAHDEEPPSPRTVPSPPPGEPRDEDLATPPETEARPDRVPPRGNPDVEEVDLERGKGKLDRILGW